ncbi:hypothetical protein ABIE37_000141 [Arthrobacter bambusae]|uniref:Uncharacterized protein n=1 Tax=Arthrobacter bambusae TaxID=1338426 RepID=A0ABV2P0X5_9MICC
MTSKYEADIVAAFERFDDIITRTQNPRHRAILMNYRTHGLLEVSGRWAEILQPAMMVDHPVYRMTQRGQTMVLDGMDQVREFYRSMDAAGALVIWPDRQLVAVADWGFAAEAEFKHFMPGHLLGGEVDDQNATYLVTQTLGMAWPYDEDCRLVGEHAWEDAASRTVVKVDPEDIITPQDFRRILAPFISKPPSQSPIPV